MITLISPYPELSAFGIRILSSYLKSNGIETRLIFLPDPEFERTASMDTAYKYPDYLLEKVVELCRDSDLVGISFFTYLFDRAVQLTEKIKKDLSVPVIWGSKHVSIKPEEGLQYADIACIGEGEDALLELSKKIINKEDYSRIPNLWVKSGDGLITKNPVRALNSDIDAYGMPDYDLKNHFVWAKDQKNIVRMTASSVEKYFEIESKQNLGRMYQTMTSRGCPHNCTYCFTFKGLYPGQRYLRHRSVDSIIRELKEIKESFPSVKVIKICDDCFMSRDADNIKEFSRQYKEKIGLPLSCLVHPATVTEEKRSYLIDAGLRFVQMGIESASENTKKLYNRNISNERVLKSTQALNKFKDRLLPLYDFIIDNPYETKEDIRDSLRFILEIPRPYRIQVFSLIFFPGTKLYEDAKKDGYVDIDDRNNYRKLFIFCQEKYHNYLFFLLNYPVPIIIMRILVSKPALRFFDNIFFNRIGGFIQRKRRGIFLKKIHQE